jgi:3-dehydroquinate dehydratase-1
MLKLGALELGGVPRLAVPLTDGDVQAHAGAVRRYADVVELRIDRFRQHDPAYVAEVCRSARALGRPVIATVRAIEEGGAVELSDAQRTALFAAALPMVDAVDVEVAAPICAPVVAQAHASGALAIVSHHDFARTPGDDELAAHCDAALRTGADVVKIATAVADSRDAERLLDFLRTRQSRGLIVIGMGSAGVATRVFFALVGSLLTYGFVGRSGAPGQLPLDELYEALRRYSPAFAAAHPA